MLSAKRKEPEPAENEADQREPMAGYKRIANDVISRIEERLEELKSRSSHDARMVLPPQRRPWGRVLMAGLLIAGVTTAVTAFAYPRSETVRYVVMRYAPQSVVDMMPQPERESYAEAGTLDLRQAAGGPSTYFRTNSMMPPSQPDNEDNGLQPMDQQQMIQRLVRDVSGLQQGMDQLRAGQDQLIRMMLRTSGANAQVRAVAPALGPSRATSTQTTGLASAPAPGPFGGQVSPPSPRRQTIVVPGPRGLPN